MSKEQPEDKVFKDLNNKQSQEESVIEEENKSSATDLAKICALRAGNFELQGEYEKAKKYYGKAMALDQNPLYFDSYRNLEEKMEKESNH